MTRQFCQPCVPSLRRFRKPFQLPLVREERENARRKLWSSNYLRGSWGPAGVLHGESQRCRFEGGKINRQSVHLTCFMRSKSRSGARPFFMALEPLWQAINGNDEPDSPYRRMIALAVRCGETWLPITLRPRRRGRPALSDEARWRLPADRQLAGAVPRESLQPPRSALARGQTSNNPARCTTWIRDPGRRR